jgi:hypothetical protein
MANTFEQRPLLESDVVVDKIQSVYGNVTVPADTTLKVGQTLISTDGGLNWTVRQEADWEAGSYATDVVVYHNGHIWTSLADSNTAEPGTDPLKWEDGGFWGGNGVLCEMLEETGDANVLTTGSVVEKNLTGYEAALLPSFFDKKIMMK